MIKSILRRDDSSHWYLVPLTLLDDFDMLRADLENNDYPSELLKLFEEKFSKFIVSNIYNIPLYSNVEFKKIKWRDNITEIGKEQDYIEFIGQLDFIEVFYIIRNYKSHGEKPGDKIFLFLPMINDFIEFDSVVEAKKYAQIDVEKIILEKFFENEN
jgi:hypothetical protein